MNELEWLRRAAVVLSDVRDGLTPDRAEAQFLAGKWSEVAEATAILHAWGRRRRDDDPAEDLRLFLDHAFNQVVREARSRARGVVSEQVLQEWLADLVRSA